MLSGTHSVLNMLYVYLYICIYIFVYVYVSDISIFTVCVTLFYDFKRLELPKLAKIQDMHWKRFIFMELSANSRFLIQNHWISCNSKQTQGVGFETN